MSIPVIGTAIVNGPHWLKKLIDSQSILKRMSDSAASLTKIDATKNLAKLVK